MPRFRILAAILCAAMGLVLLTALPAWLRTPALVALDGGLRAGEIGALTRRDVDFRKGIVTIRESKNREARQVAMTSIVACEPSRPAGRKDAASRRHWFKYACFSSSLRSR